MFEALMVPLFVPEKNGAAVAGASTTRCMFGRRSSTASKKLSTATGAFRRPTIPTAATASMASTRSASSQTGMPPTRSGRWSTMVSAIRRGPATVRAAPSPPPADYGRGVVTPHASFLALKYAPEEALDNLAKLRADFDAYGWGGFYDAIDVEPASLEILPGARPGHDHGRAG